MTKATAKNRIREFRQKLGITTRDLAERLDTTGATISRLESGKQNLSQTWLQKIAQTLGVPIAALLDEGPQIGTDFAPVIAMIEDGKWLEEYLYEPARICSIPVVASDKWVALQLVAFAWAEPAKGWSIATELSKLQATNYIGKPFVVHRIDQRPSELSREF